MGRSYRALCSADWNPLWRSPGEGDPLGRDRRRKADASRDAVEVVTEYRPEEGMVTLIRVRNNI